MLSLLYIENIAVIEKAELSFGPGMNVLTGETGAGKSIVIDALYAVTGGRVGRELIRAGAKSAVVSAVFSGPFPEEWFEENGLETGEDGTLILMRKMSSDGKNTCRINGMPVTLTQLREIGGALLDIHGQNDGRKLLDEASHRHYLDAFSHMETELMDYRQKYDEVTALRKKLRSLTLDEGEKERRADMLQFRINELEKANIVPGEYAEKQARLELVKNASKLMDALESAEEALFGAERSDGAITLAEEAEHALNRVTQYSPELENITERLTEARYNIADAAEELRDYRREIDFSPGELEELEERINKLRRLMKKYGGDEQTLISSLEIAKEELEEIEYSGDVALKTEKQLLTAEKEAEKLAAGLTQLRRKGALTLEKKVLSELFELNMKGVRFSADIRPVPLNEYGADEVSFLMSANPGEEPGKISRIASGGELSRIMLALKNVLAEHDSVGTMIFDEIDTGVSGIAAQRVGEKLWRLARARQVLCVTHLPQIAVMADTQFSVEKTVNGDRTYTEVRKLDADGRLSELSRLTAGEYISSATLAGAQELLNAAAAYKMAANT